MNDEAYKVMAEYRRFIAEVDERLAQLGNRHGARLRCAPGCDDCCRVERTALLVEAERLRRAVADLPERTRERLKGAPPSPSRCALLLEGFCAVYEARPLICRTHGAPLLVDTGEEWGVSICELNLAGFSDRDDFGDDDLFDTVEANDRLSLLNDRFVAATGCGADRVPLRDLLGG